MGEGRPFRRYGPPADFAILPVNSLYAYGADGAITIAPGVHELVKATAGAYTLADPGVDLDGTVLTITAKTAAAHTVTSGSGGFNGGGTASDVATFGGAIGDSFIVAAVGGKWNTVSLRNGTLG